MLQRFSEKKRKGVAWLLLFLLCFSVVDIPSAGKAALRKTGLIGNSHDPVSNVFKMYGLHYLTDEEPWTWRTVAFTVANGVCPDITNPPAEVKTTRLRINQNLSHLKIMEDTEYTASTYVISGRDLANAFQMLYKDEIEKAVANGQRSYRNRLYFNNIFKVVYRSDAGITRRENDAEMYPEYSFQSTEEYHTASAMADNPYYKWWTASMFEGFYNYPYWYTVNILETKVNYVDKKTGKHLVTDAESVYGLSSGYIHYSLPEKQIMVNGKTYTYNGSAALDKKDGFNPMIMHSFDGSLTWTMDRDGMVLDIYFDEGKEIKEVPVKIHREAGMDGSNYTTRESFDYGSKVLAGERFSYTPDAAWKDDSGNTYNYTEKWHYTYTDTDGKEVRVSDTAEGVPLIYRVPEVEEGSSLNVYIRYDAEKQPELTKAPATTPAVTPIPTKAPATTPTVTPAPTGTPAITPTVTPAPTGTPAITPTATPFPTGTPTATPSPSPSPTPTPVKQPSSNQTAPPNQGSHWKDVPVPTSVAVIRAEEESENRYDVMVAVPTQEDLYTQGDATSYMLGYSINHTTGTKIYPVRVDKTYILEWKEGDEKEGTEEEPKTLTEEVNLTTYVYVTRGYGYWEIENFTMYVPDRMTIYNYALPGGSVTMTVNTDKLNAELPDISVTDYDENIVAPVTALDGIVLPKETITSGDNKKPEIPRKAFEILAYNAVHSKTGNIKVQNDHLVYRGITVLDAAQKEYLSPAITVFPLEWSEGGTVPKLFHEGNMVIDAKKDNGAYFSTGTVTYRAASVNVGGDLTKTYPLTKDPNQVLIHTPVICDAVVESDNDRYVQLTSPLYGGEVHQLVLDENSTLNDFTVSINNAGEHIPFQGYFTRNYRKILRLPDSDLSNIERDVNGELRNEVRFRFDVYLDAGNDYDVSNDIFYPAGTWFVLGERTQRFYLPLTVKEGIYGADFRTVAVNANGRLSLTQSRVNTDSENYVATDTMLFEVSGRVYGLNVYDVTDYPIWGKVFRIPGQLHFKINNQDRYPLGVNSTAYFEDKSYNYTVGTKDRYGNDTGRDPKFTLPLVGGSHPYYGDIGALKRGYSVRFSLDTIGTYYADTAKVIATPTYYWVDEEGKNRTKVDMYYSAEVGGKSRALIKSGEAIDLVNVRRYRAGDRKFGIPEDELSVTAAIRGLLAWVWEWEYADLVFGTSKVCITAPFRTYTGSSYAKGVMDGPNRERIINAGTTKKNLIMAKQSWYGETFIPGTAMFVKEGTDVFGHAKRYGINYAESFWKKDGYIIINLDIKVYDDNGKARLSYVNKENEEQYCNMWRLEGAPISKSSKGKMAFTFEDGDFMIYSVEQSASDDYVVGGIY